ncbi:hypothetical protein D1007_05611 [Hordeum vulgare]|nr:hypothetical protein D1007_05611 [Hordeum vulgare]
MSVWSSSKRASGSAYFWRMSRRLASTSAVTSRDCQLEITADDGNLQQHRGLFRATEPPILATPSRRPSAPPKSRTAATPTRHSARLAANTSTIPVAQRASFRIVKDLGLLGPREKLTEDVAKALIRRFEEPL